MSETVELKEGEIEISGAGKVITTTMEELKKVALTVRRHENSSAKWAEAPATVIDMAQELIRAYHGDLMEARIGFLMRTEPSNSMGRRILGHAAKVSEQHKLLLDLDYLIWIDEEKWSEFGEEQRRALIDHELYHCDYNVAEGKASMRGHDVEEFSAIAERYGAWTAALMEFSRRLDRSDAGRMNREGEQVPRQLSMLPPRGSVVSVDVQLAQGIEEP